MFIRSFRACWERVSGEQLEVLSQLLGNLGKDVVNSLKTKCLILTLKKIFFTGSEFENFLWFILILQTKYLSFPFNTYYINRNSKYRTKIRLSSFDLHVILEHHRIPSDRGCKCSQNDCFNGGNLFLKTGCWRAY